MTLRVLALVYEFFLYKHMSVYLELLCKCVQRDSKISAILQLSVFEIMRVKCIENIMEKRRDCSLGAMSPPFS